MIQNCYLSPIINVDRVVYRCTRCRTGYIPIVKLDNAVNVPIIGFLYAAKVSPMQSYHAVTCRKAIELNMSGKKLTTKNEVVNCAYYYEWK